MVTLHRKALQVLVHWNSTAHTWSTRIQAQKQRFFKGFKYKADRHAAIVREKTENFYSTLVWSRPDWCGLDWTGVV
uniref:Uncharacterized protein n=1 Tax=Anguilla anguilla TaxID=7936 RepID=A0A0E9RSZ2_ANGAN